MVERKRLELSTPTLRTWFNIRFCLYLLMFLAVGCVESCVIGLVDALPNLVCFRM